MCACCVGVKPGTRGPLSLREGKGWTASAVVLALHRLHDHSAACRDDFVRAADNLRAASHSERQGVRARGKGSGYRSPRRLREHRHRPRWTAFRSSSSLWAGAPESCAKRVSQAAAFPGGVSASPRPFLARWGRPFAVRLARAVLMPPSQGETRSVNDVRLGGIPHQGRGGGVYRSSLSTLIRMHHARSGLPFAGDWACCRKRRASLIGLGNPLLPMGA